MCNISETVDGDFVLLDEHDGVSSFADARYALGELAQFGSVRFSPHLLVLWIDEEMTHLHEFPSVLVEDCIEDLGRKLSACCIGCCESAGGDVPVGGDTG
jgi:hypothetical protein